MINPGSPKLILAITAFLTFVPCLSNAQTPVKFYEVIEGDSVAMFFNDDNKYVDLKCATNVRYTKLDKGGNFNGSFEDYQLNPRVLRASGGYINGKKNGHFILYNPDGKIQSKGEYVNNKPQGTWEFFRDNGLPERQVSITPTDTLLVRLVSIKGDLLVDNGNGQFEGLVSGNFRSKNEILAKGKISNGKPVGKWTSITLENQPFCNEEFDDHGKFIKGVFPGAKSKSKHNKDRSFLANPIPADYLSSIETISLGSCESGENGRFKMDFNFRNFSFELRQELNWVFSQQPNTYFFATTFQAEEIHYLTIQFDVQENSVPDNFEMVTNWGSEYYKSITSLIKRNARFSGAAGKMYFHLRLLSRSAQYYQWSFRFSESSEVKF